MGDRDQRIGTASEGWLRQVNCLILKLLQPELKVLAEAYGNRIALTAEGSSVARVIYTRWRQRRLDYRNDRMTRRRMGSGVVTLMRIHWLGAWFGENRLPGANSSF